MQAGRSGTALILTLLGPPAIILFLALAVACASPSRSFADSRASATPVRASVPPASSEPAPPPHPPAELTVCTQNLWNYGSPADVHTLRRPNVSLARVTADLARQEPALVSRLTGCDVVAVQELVGADDRSAQASLDRLAKLLSDGTGHPYAAKVADTHDVIRNGFMMRTDAAFREVAFSGAHSADPMPSLGSFPRGKWDRGPAELVLEIAPRAIPAQAAQAGQKGKSSRQANPPIRLRIIDAHFKSKAVREDKTDPYGESFERLRILQAQALADLARRRGSSDPKEFQLIVGDFNSGRDSATRAVLTGTIEPARLVSPKDCISADGQIACELGVHAPLLVDLAGQDPDLRGRGSYRFKGQEELIDGIFATPAAARLAAEPGAEAGDYSVALIGRFWQGSDHRLLRVTLHY